MGSETDEYIRESIENLRLKLLASEDARRRLQDQIFVLEERLKDTEKRLKDIEKRVEQAEATINALELRRCIEEKEMVASGSADFINDFTNDLINDLINDFIKEMVVSGGGSLTPDGAS